MKSSGQRALSVLTLVCLLGTTCVGCARAKPPRELTAPVELASGDQQVVAQVAEEQIASYPEPTATIDPASSTPSVSYPVPTDSPTATPSLAATMPSATSTVAAPVATDTPILTPTATTAPKTDVEHIVMQGESLLSIARRYNTTVTAIMNRNGLVNQNTIYAGTKLVIPVGYTAEETPPTGTIVHVVLAGETLSQLARTYRTSVASIKAHNPAVTADPDHVKPGTTLTIAVGDAPQVRTHQVRVGESLSAIARRYQVSVSALAQANGLRNPNQVVAGQMLVIP